MEYQTTTMEENPAYAVSKISKSSHHYYQDLEEIKLQQKNLQLNEQEATATTTLPHVHSPRKGLLNKPDNIIKSCSKYFQPVVMIILLLANVTVLMAITLVILNMKQQECTNGSYISALEELSEIYQSRASINNSYAFTLMEVLERKKLSPNRSYIIALEELLDKYNDKLNSSNTCSINDTSAGVVNLSVCNFCQSEMNSTWIRVAELDISDPSSQCPVNLILNTSNGVRLCMTMMRSRGCSSVFFSTHNVTYSKVFGKIRAYQYDGTNAFNPFNRGNGTIDEPYVDGISLTYGHPRQHIWTFAADLK